MMRFNANYSKANTDKLVFKVLICVYLNHTIQNDTFLV